MKLPADYSPEERLAAGLLERMARKDADALQLLYELYQRPLLAYIDSIVRDSGAAEEILQDLFVRSYEQASRFDPALGAPFTWMATIARRFSIDWLRKHRRKADLIDPGREQVEGFADKVFQDDDLQDKLESRDLVGYLARLPEGQGRAIELAFLGGFTHQEIAEKTGKPLGTVKSDLRRGLLRLRKWYLGADD